MLNKLHKKLRTLEKKYQKLDKSARVKRARLMKTYQATGAKIAKITGKDPTK